MKIYIVILCFLTLSCVAQIAEREVSSVRPHFKSEYAFTHHIEGLFPGAEIVESSVIGEFYVGLFHISSTSTWFFADSPRKWDWRFGARPSDSLRVVDPKSRLVMNTFQNTSSKLNEGFDGWCIRITPRSAVQYSWPEGIAFELPAAPSEVQLTWDGLKAPWIVKTVAKKTSKFDLSVLFKLIGAFVLGAVLSLLFTVWWRQKPSNLVEPT